MSKEKETGKEKRRIRQLARYYIPYTGDSTDCTVYYEYGCGKAAGAGNG